MAQRFVVMNDDGDLVEITDAIDETTVELTEYAEEGSTAMSTVLFDDPGLAIDFTGLRRFNAYEDETYGVEWAFFRGFVAERTFMRGKQPLGRQIQASVVDLNTVFTRRVMVGADCKRPAETDVARMQWLVTTVEANLIDDDTTYLSTASPVNMDKCDYRGQFMSQVADDCAQASGKNWGLTYDFVTGDGVQLWYGHDSLTTYDSGLLLTNDAALVDGVTAFAISEDTRLVRDPSRVFSGVYLPYERGAVYRTDTGTSTAFRAQRDTVMPSANVKTKAKASARALRYLDDLDEEDDRIETSIIVTAPDVNILRPFHRVQFQASHLPGYELPVHCRVAKRTVSYFAPRMYRLTLTLTGHRAAAAMTCATAIALAEADSDVGVGADGFDPDSVIASVTTTPAYDGTMFAWLIGYGANIAGSYDMNPAISGYTTLHNYAGDPTKSSTNTLAYRSVSGNVPVTASADYMDGYSVGVWMGVHILLPSVTVVQGSYTDEGYNATLPAPPTPGNIVLMFCYYETGADMEVDFLPGGDSGGPTTGWTKLYHGFTDYVNPYAADPGLIVEVYARCVVEDETGDYGFTTGGHFANKHCQVVEVSL